MRKYAIAIGLTIVSGLTPLPAKAVSLINEITSIYAFGDSLSDTGNLFNATGLPPFPYFDGRFSNGQNWIDYLSQDLGLDTPTPITDVRDGTAPTNGINFAFGGATTGLDNTVSPGLLGLQQQVGAFASLIAPGGVDPNGLYLLWGGANDYLPSDSTTFTPFDNPTQTIDNLSAAITTLAGLGAKNIMVVNQPDFGSIPRVLGNDPSFSLSPDTPTLAEFNALSNSHNTQLDSLLDSLSNDPLLDLNLLSLDVNSLFRQAISDPALGFTNTTEPCLFTITCVFNPSQQEQFLFWDGLHITTRAHELVAQQAFATLEHNAEESVPEPNSAIGILAMGVLGGGALLKRQRQLKSVVIKS
ncbi:SGNH/GDSL hydrolase family protein [Lusitaniella coriacea]|uniref:SGNH/GDSL hydrolase family protein n=1 Tax=Lusitaniella coriacea TaxID=1983105 RepID=UPI003CF381FA